MTWTKQRHRLNLFSVVLMMALGVVSVSHAQRFVRPINSIPELVASNPNDPHTNVFIPQGPTGPGLFYQWRKNDGTTTNSNLSVLGTDWPGAFGRWHNIPVAQGSITGISNSGTNGFAVVNTLSDLRNIPGNLGIGMVYIRGHSQAYDWGQGFFSRVDDCSVPDDDGLTSVHGNDALTCWTRENRFPWSGTPVQYAGGTVTRTIINTVSEYLSTQGGGTVIITDGSWNIDTSNGPILGHSNVSIVGMASALLVGDGTGDMFNWTNVSNAAILQVGISNCVNGVVIRGATNVLIGGNPISQVGNGVHQYGGDNVRIEHNIFSNLSTNAIRFSLDGAVKVTGGSLIGNTFSGVIGAEVLVDSGSTDGYRRLDSGSSVNFTALHNRLFFGTEQILRNTLSSTFLGKNAGTNETVANGANTGVGENALTAVTTGSGNTAVGRQAGKAITTGLSNIAIGSGALDDLVNGIGNTAVGPSALSTAINTTSDTAIGQAALQLYNPTNSSLQGRNVAIGQSAGASLVQGYANTLIGNSAAGPSSVGPSTNGIHNVIMGYQAGVGNDSHTNATAIGSFAITMGSNTVNLGDTNVTTLYVGGDQVWPFTAGDSLWTNIAGVVQLVTQTNEVHLTRGLFIGSETTFNSYWGTPLTPDQFLVAGRDKANGDNPVLKSFLEVIGDGKIGDYRLTIETNLVELSVDVTGTGSAGILRATPTGAEVVADRFISGNPDPADSGVLRLANAESIAWESNPAGTDLTMGVDAANVMRLISPFSIDTAIDHSFRMTYQATNLVKIGFLTANTFEYNFTNSGVGVNTRWMDRAGVRLAEIKNSGNLVIGATAAEPNFGNGISFNGQTIREYVAVTVTADSYQISAAGTKFRLTASAARNLTNTPTITGATDGAEIFFQGTSDANTVTINDNDSVAGTLVQLGAASRVLGKGDILKLHYDATDGFWYEADFSNN